MIIDLNNLSEQDRKELIRKAMSELGKKGGAPKNNKNAVGNKGGRPRNDGGPRRYKADAP